MKKENELLKKEQNKGYPHRIIYSLLVFIIIVLSASTYRYYDSSSNLSKQIDSLKSANTELINENDELSVKNGALVEQNESLLEEKAQFDTKIEDYETKITNLQTKIDNLKEYKTKYKTLKTENKSLQSQVTKLKSSNSKSNTSSSNSSEEDSDYGSYTVYITKTGEKYHSGSCKYLSQSKISISKSEAVSRGYTACSKCNP